MQRTDCRMKGCIFFFVRWNHILIFQPFWGYTSYSKGFRYKLRKDALSPFQLQMTASVCERPQRATWALQRPTYFAAVVHESTMLFLLKGSLDSELLWLKYLRMDEWINPNLCYLWAKLAETFLSVKYFLLHLINRKCFYINHFFSEFIFKHGRKPKAIETSKDPQAFFKETLVRLVLNNHSR